jgi:hypothetical protein
VTDTGVDQRAARLLDQHAKVIKFAAVKATRKWYGYVTTRGCASPFSFEDINQYAREAILILGGLIPGSGLSISGALADMKAEGGERYVQRAVDFYVSSRLRREAGAVARDKRGGGEIAESLDARWDGWAESSRAVETAEQSLTGIPARFPILYLTFVEGWERHEVIAAEGITAHAFDAARAAEVVEFARWARANRRVVPGAEPLLSVASLRKTSRRRGVCPYDDPDCTSIHDTRKGKANTCPSAWEAKRTRDRAADARHRARLAAA